EIGRGEEREMTVGDSSVGSGDNRSSSSSPRTAGSVGSRGRGGAGFSPSGCDLSLAAWGSWAGTASPRDGSWGDGRTPECPSPWGCWGVGIAGGFNLFNRAPASQPRETRADRSIGAKAAGLPHARERRKPSTRKGRHGRDAD